jgi:type I restriction enzyme, S subunit
MVPQELHREVCSTGFCVLRANKQQLNPRFLYFYLLSEPVRQRVEALQTGATYPAINDGDLLRMEIALPPLSEQQAIAHVLQTVQKAKEARQRELVLERERKAALMERLFTHGTRGEKTNETEIGNIPESWSVLPMATVAKIERGKFAHRPRNDPAYYGGTTPFVQTGDVTASDGHITKYSQTLNERGLSVSKIFPRGTILITIAANIGFSAILEFDSAFPDSLIGITPNECIDAEFLNYYLMTQQPEMDRKAPRGTQKNINIEFLAPWKVPVPPLDEQLRIASALRASDRKSKGLRQETALLTELFDVMLKDLMTGRISASALVEKAQ